MLARVRSAAVLGIDAYLVDVETDITSGLPTFVTVGLPQGGTFPSSASRVMRDGVVRRFPRSGKGEAGGGRPPPRLFRPRDPGLLPTGGRAGGWGAAPPPERVLV